METFFPEWHSRRNWNVKLLTGIWKMFIQPWSQSVTLWAVEEYVLRNCISDFKCLAITMKPESQDYPEKGFQNPSCPRLLSYPQLLPQLFALGPSQFLFISCSPGPLSLPILLLCKLQPMLWPSHFLSRWLCPPECRHDCPFSVCVGMGQVGGCPQELGITSASLQLLPGA